MKAIILTNDKKVQRVDIPGEKPEFSFRGGLYILEPQAINRRIDSPNGEVRYSEAIYFESTSTPIPLARPGEDSGDPSGTYLGAYVIQNALEQTGGIHGLGAVSSIYKEIKNLATLRNLVLGIIGGSIAYSLFTQAIGGA